MTLAAKSPGVARQRCATRQSLTSDNLSQTEEVMKNLKKLRAFFETRIPQVSPDMRPVYQEMLDQVVTRLERLEHEDQDRQRLEREINSLESRELRKRVHVVPPARSRPKDPKDPNTSWRVGG